MRPRPVLPFGPAHGILLAVVAASPAAAAPSADTASQLFAEADAICHRDDGAHWGRSLCGPILLVDWTDRGVLANRADADGTLAADGALFRGTLPASVIIANTPTDWSGTRWTQLVAPVPDDAAQRRVLLAHELFHRIQGELGLTRSAESGNRHLDGFDGRYFMQLEWRALEAALRAGDADARKAAILDAVAFRRARHRLSPGAAAEELALEVNEGVAEYTGVRLGLDTAAARTAYAIHDLHAFVAAPTFVRSFAYATGPAWGLLLDDAEPGWHRSAGDGRRFDERLLAALRLDAPDGGDTDARAARYDGDGTMRMRERARDAERRARLDAYRTRLVDGPVLVLPLDDSRFQFNPQTLVPLDGHGMVYPTLRLDDRWGSLEVESGGALVHDTPRRATVTAVGADTAGARGDGWRLTLASGWVLRPGDRAGDLLVACEGECGD